MSIERILAHLEKLVGFDTCNPPRRIHTQSELFKYLESALGGVFELRTWDHGDGHVTFLAQRGSPGVLFNVHLDTVPVGDGWRSDPFKLTLLNDKAYARGACDIKGAAACLLALAEQAPENMAVLFTTDEEGAGGCCVQRFLEEGCGKGFRQVVVAEPTGCKAILGHRGFLSLKAWFEGVPGHSSEARSLEDNAIHQFSRWAAAGLELADSLKASDSDPGTCLNIGLVEGGTKSNVIAGSVFAHASARLMPGESNDAFVAKLKACAPDGARARWEVPFKGEPLPAGGQDASGASAFADALELETGEPVDFWTEASIFSQFGLPALVLGPGHIEQAHVADEWVSIAQLSRAHQIYQRIIENDEGGRQSP